MASPKKRPTWQDAFDTQMALWRWTCTAAGQRWLLENLRTTLSALPYRRDGMTDMLLSLYTGEDVKLLGADPIYVSEEMCEVVAAAYPEFEPEPLVPTDLVTLSGFIFYETPFLVRDRFDTPTTIAAVSWSPILSSETTNAISNLITDSIPSGSQLHVGRQHMEALMERLQKTDYIGRWNPDGRQPNDAVDGLSISIYASTKPAIRDAHEDRTFPDLLPMHITPWWFGMSYEGNEFDENGVSTGAAWWWKIVQSTFRLMQQRITAHSRYQPERHSRREGARRGFYERDVIVVRLRRENTDQFEPSGEEAHYSHRFIVNGHWRNAWYPSERVHRQIWISSYVKGPTDKPLIVKPRRAFAWSR